MEQGLGPVGDFAYKIKPLFLRNELRISVEPLLTVASTIRTPLYVSEFPLSPNFYVAGYERTWYVRKYNYRDDVRKIA